MSEGFDLSTFHVPQQSRRDKLRETAAAAAAAAAASQGGLLPLYDHPALLTFPSSILTCATPDTAPHLVKEEGLNFMGFAAASSSSSHVFLDPCSQEDIPSPFFYPAQHTPHAHPVRDFCYPAQHAALSYAPPAQGLSLSLSSSSSEYPNRSTAADQPTVAIFDQKGGGSGCAAARGLSIVGGGGMSRSSVPLGPFTGYAAVLKGSRFLEPARELLEEFCDVGRGGIAVPRGAGAGAGSSAEEDREMESLSGAVIGDGAAGISEDRRRKTRLVSLLNEVCVVQQYWSLLTSLGTDGLRTLYDL